MRRSDRHALEELLRDVLDPAVAPAEKFKHVAEGMRLMADILDRELGGSE